MKGFTLIELMIVLAIIVILSSITIPAVMGLETTTQPTYNNIITD